MENRSYELFAALDEVTNETASDAALATELRRLESERERLAGDLLRAETRLRRLRTDAVCPRCFGSGERPVRGGLYGEVRLQLCSCRVPAFQQEAAKAHD